MKRFDRSGLFGLGLAVCVLVFLVGGVVSAEGQPAGGEWVPQSTGLLRVFFTGVSFVGANTGTVVGEGGLIARTTDGGVNWVQQASGTTQWMRAVSFTDVNTGTAVGDGGTILRTTDGGATWVAQVSPVNTALTAVYFIDANTGTAVGGSGTIIHTIDGGVTWAEQSSGAMYSLQGVYFTDANTGWAVGLHGSLVRTIDGGTTWTMHLTGALQNLYGVSFVNTAVGTAVGSYGTIVHTIDGGLTWTAQSSGTTETLYGVSYTDATTGTAVGGSGTIVHTTDSGVTWTTLPSGVFQGLYSVSFITAAIGTAVGEEGTVIRTTDGGATWTLQASSTTPTLYGVSYVNATTGTAVGDWGMIFQTTDGGETWSVRSSGTMRPLFGVSFSGGTMGWAVGVGGMIVHTADGGATWNAQVSGTTEALYGVYFVDATTGWAVGANRTIRHTTDGGVTWTQQSSWASVNYLAVSFANATTGWVVGDGGLVLHTTDGGVTWTPQPLGIWSRLQGVSFADASTGTVVGMYGRIFHTTDGGVTWTQQASGTLEVLRAVYFANVSTGTAVGDLGTILHTSDGGETWAPQLGGTTQDLFGVSFVSGEVGTAVGASGTVLRHGPTQWVAPPVVFTNTVSQYPALQNWGAGNSSTWVDYDGDGDLDLAVGAGGNDPNQMFTNQLTEYGLVSFIPSQDPNFSFPNPSRGIGWGVLGPGDDLPDMYLGAPYQGNVLISNMSTGTIDTTDTVTAGTSLRTNGVRLVDFDNDGFLDIHEINGNGPDRLLRNLGQWNFQDVAQSPFTLFNNSVDAAWCDVDADGDQDVYIVRETSGNSLFRNDGGGVFVDVTPALLADTGRGQSASWGDYDNDGNLDLFITNWGTADRLFHNDGLLQFTEITAPFAASTLHGQSAMWGDWDNDADLDLYVTNYGEANQLFINDGAGVFTDRATGDAASLDADVGATCGDYDGDGDLDIFVGTQMGVNKLLRNETVLPVNDWLDVELTGVVSNPSAIGARIVLRAGATTQTRVVGAGNGLWGQNQLAQHFGLAFDTRIDQLDVYWPSGLVSRFAAIPIHQTFRVAEPVDWFDRATGPVADSGTSAGLAFGDFDGDGDDDLYLVKTAASEPNVLLVSNGDGTFTECTPPVLADTGRGSDASWADFDQDGDLDLFLANIGQPNRLFENLGQGAGCWNFQDITSGAIADSQETMGAEWVDYDHDGRLEIYVSNRNGANQMLISRYNFANIVPAELDYPGGSQGFGWCDGNVGMKPDLYLVTEPAPHVLLKQSDAHTFSPVNIPQSTGGQGCSWADYDNDGDFDVFVTFWLQNNVLLENTGSGGFMPVSSSVFGNFDDSKGSAWGDYDNDGFIDLYVANQLGDNRLYHNDAGTGQFTLVNDPNLHAIGNSVGVAWSDVDADGDLDLMVGNNNSSNQLLRNGTALGNHWLNIKVQGHPSGGQSNLDALGALIKVEAGGLTMWRSVSAGSGYLSQAPMVQHFGLGSATMATTVTVSWPFGLTTGGHHSTVLTAVAADQTVTITEPAYGVSGVSDGGGMPSAYSLGAAYPNPFNPMTTIRYALPRPSRVDLRIYDLAGRLVRTLVDGKTLAAGRREVVWRGRDQADRPVATGVYLYRLEAGTFTETKRMTLVK